MQGFYFPIFLIVLAIGVIWLFRKVQTGDSGRNRRHSRGVNSSQRAGRPKQAAWREPLGEDHKTKDVWHPKRERVLKESFTESATERSIIHAGYIGPYASSGGKLHSKEELLDQGISESEHLGIDEYLTKRDRELAEKKAKAAEEDSLTMRAVKYEPTGASSDAEEKDTPKQASFKP